MFIFRYRLETRGRWVFFKSLLNFEIFATQLKRVFEGNLLIISDLTPVNLNFLWRFRFFYHPSFLIAAKCKQTLINEISQTSFFPFLFQNFVYETRAAGGKFFNSRASKINSVTSPKWVLSQFIKCRLLFRRCFNQVPKEANCLYCYRFCRRIRGAAGPPTPSFSHSFR